MKESTKVLILMALTLVMWAIVYPQEFAGYAPDTGDVVFEIMVASYFICRAIEAKK